MKIDAPLAFSDGAGLQRVGATGTSPSQDQGESAGLSTDQVQLSVSGEQVDQLKTQLSATPDVRQADLAEAVATVASGAAPFGVTLSGGGAFPDARSPRVLWIGIVEGAPELNLLAGRLNGALERLGWAADDRPFQAHLTLARTDGVAGADQAATRLIDAARDLRLSWTPDRLVLYKSVLGRGPSRYEIVSEASFGGE